MKKLLIVSLASLGILCNVPKLSIADDAAFFKIGPLSLNVPFKTGMVTYMYDFNANKNLIGGETILATVWDRVEGTLGAVTSLDGQGTPFVGGNILLGNLLDRWVTLPSDIRIGGFGGYDFNAETPIYGLKASYKLW